MSDRLTGPRSSDQLSLPVKWWESFAYDPITLELEQSIDELASTPEHRTTNLHHHKIQGLQINLAKRALEFYGVGKIGKVKSFDNAYQFDFNYDGNFVDTVWYNHKSLSVKTWHKGINKPERNKIWRFYDDETKLAQESHAFSQDDPALAKFCALYGFRRFTLRTSSQDSHLRTRYALPAALHLINMPVTESYPIIGPGQDDIEVIEPGKIATGCNGKTNVWLMDNQGSFSTY